MREVKTPRFLCNGITHSLACKARVAPTDIFGDVIPTAVQKKNEIWEKNYTINASGYNVANCKVVAFVQYTENNVSRWGVLNAQVAKAGNNAGFD